MYPATPVTCRKTNSASELENARWDCHTSSVLYRAFLRIHHARVHCEAVKGVIADSTLCTLDYYLDYTMLAVFLLGFVATALCGGLVAMAIYVALGKVMKDYQAMNRVGRDLIRMGARVRDDDFTDWKGGRREDEHAFCSSPMEDPMDIPVRKLTADELRAIYTTPSGYGSFGRKLEVVGDFCGSFTTQTDVEQSTTPPPEMEVVEEEEGDDESEKGDEDEAAERRRRDCEERLAVLHTELLFG